MLMDIKSYLLGRGPASLSEIAIRLASDPETIRPMLDHWMRKGKVRQVGKAGGCHGCTQCPPGDLEFYEWAPASSNDRDPGRKDSGEQ